MYIPKYEFSGNVKLINLGDIHRGDDSCDVNTLHKTIDYIRKDDDARWYSTGDLLNVALKNSKSSVYSSMSPKKELKTLKAELEPIARKCLGFVGSNHHNRIDNETGLSLDEYIAAELNIPYLGKIGLICVKVGASCYYMAMHHGTGGGKKRGGKVNSLSELAVVLPGADIYSEGHSHSYVSFVDDVPYIDRKRTAMQMVPATFVTTGHYLKWEGSYAQDSKYKPMPIGSSILELYASEGGNKKKVVVDLLTH